MGGGDEKQAVTNNYQETMREALEAQIDLAPDLYRAESNNNYGRPAYARMMQDLANESIQGQSYEYDSQGRVITGYNDLESSYTIDSIDDLYGTRTTEKTTHGSYDHTTEQELNESRAKELEALGVDNKYNYLVRDLDGNVIGSAMNEEEANAIRGRQEKRAIYKRDKAGNIIQDYSKRNTTERQGGGLASILGGDNVSEFYDGRSSRAGYDEDGNFLGTSQLEQDILERAKRQQVQGEVGMANEFGQELTQAYRKQGDIQGALDDFKALGKQNSDHGGLRSLMTQTAMDEFKMGGQLTDRERLRAQQASRSAMSARGMARSFAGVVDEVEKNELMSRQRENERRQFASYALQSADAGLAQDRAYSAQRVGLEQATSADPFMAITGRTSGAGVGSGQNLYGNTQAGMAGSPALFNPAQGAEFMANQSAMVNSYNSAIYGADQARSGAIIGGAMSAVGNVAGAFAKPKGCWVAREVYGEHNPTWKLFRHWMLFLSPFWFRSIYLTFGERFARFIKNKPRLKARIRAWMDTKIKETF